MCKLLKLQAFNDGNKRTSILDFSIAYLIISIFLIHCGVSLEKEYSLFIANLPKAIKSAFEFAVLSSI